MRGTVPAMRITTVRRDKRWRGADPVPAPSGAKTLTRDQVAAACGVSTRTVSRWAETGVLTKYLDVMGRVVFLFAEVEQIIAARGNGETEERRPDPPAGTQQGRRPRRW